MHIPSEKISGEQKYPDGRMRSCILTDRHKLVTSCGTLLPKYGEETLRYRNSPSLTFYHSGALRSVALECSTLIDTPAGNYPAELVTFYESGALKRFFPLNGKLSGFWSEQDEAALCGALRFKLTCGSFTAKIISMCFYENGAVKAVTLWPGEEIVIRTNRGLFPVRNVFSLYENGNIRSAEPAYELTISTPIGNIPIWDNTACGINYDNGSLHFSSEGEIISFKTLSASITVRSSEGSRFTVSPALLPDMADPEVMVREPISVRIIKDEVIFTTGGDSVTVLLKNTEFTPIYGTAGVDNATSCSGKCSGCTGCG